MFLNLPQWYLQLERIPSGMVHVRGQITDVSLCEPWGLITADSWLFSPASWQRWIVTRTDSYLPAQAGIQLFNRPLPLDSPRFTCLLLKRKMVLFQTEMCMWGDWTRNQTCANVARWKFTLHSVWAHAEANKLARFISFVQFLSLVTAPGQEIVWQITPVKPQLFFTQRFLYRFKQTRYNQTSNQILLPSDRARLAVSSCFQCLC